VNQVVGIEPALKLIEMACQASHADIPIEFVEASAEAIPMKDRSIDTVVTTWTMSSIPDVDRAIMEAGDQNSCARQSSRQSSPRRDTDAPS